MTARQLPLARWHVNLNATRPPSDLREWLGLQSSLTARLRERCMQFSIKRLSQGFGVGLHEERRAIGLPQRACVCERDVLLCCDSVPVVFAHTAMPPASCADWPAFRTLGERSLGTLLFSDPQVVRGSMQFARLPLTHPLIHRINYWMSSAIPGEQIESRLYARRCIFRRKRSLMLVTEVFLPEIVKLN